MTTSRATRYLCWLVTPDGRRILPLRNIVELSATLPVNAAAALSVTLPYHPLLQQAIEEPDWRLECWRKASGRRPYLLHQSQFIIRDGSIAERRRHTPVVTLEGQSGESLLDDRIVAYAANSAEAAKSSQAIDSMMAEIVDENFGAGAASDRKLTSLTIVPASGTGPSTSRAFSRQRVLSVVQGLAEEAAQLGTPVFFAVPWTGAGWRFETFVGLRGVDHSRSTGAAPVVFSTEAGTLSNPVLRVDRTEERSVIYAGGAGREEDRIIEPASDAARIAASEIGRREGWRDARNGGTTVAFVQAEARSELRARRARRVFSGEATDPLGFDVRWGLGDRVTASFYGQFECRIDVVRIGYRGRRETVTAALRGEEAL